MRPEQAYDLMVPDAALDLIVRTDVGATASTDTVVHIRRDCDDPATEVGCVDDIRGMLAAHVELLDAAPGAYTIFVEPYSAPGMMAVPFNMEVALRPVLAMGATCDAMGVMNRCADGPCTGGTCP